MPIATPISAFLSAGESLTPSPVIDTILPRLCQASTILILFSGETLAYTVTLSKILSCSSDILSSSTPFKAISSSSIIPICFAIAPAVILWSPVIIIVFMPAIFALRTASILSSLGGSIILTNPTKV